MAIQKVKPAIFLIILQILLKTIADFPNGLQITYREKSSFDGSTVVEIWTNIRKRNASSTVELNIAGTIVKIRYQNNAKTLSPKWLMLMKTAELLPFQKLNLKRNLTS